MSKPHVPKRVNAERTCVADGECRPKHVAHKDTNRWCRGHEGVEHQWVTTKTPCRARDLQPGELGWFTLDTTCGACGKKKWRWGERECHCGAAMVPSTVDGWSNRWCAACGCQPSCNLPGRSVRQADGTWRYVLKHPRVECACEKEARRVAYARKFAAKERRADGHGTSEA